LLFFDDQQLLPDLDLDDLELVHDLWDLDLDHFEDLDLEDLELDHDVEVHEEDVDVEVHEEEEEVDHEDEEEEERPLWIERTDVQTAKAHG